MKTGRQILTEYNLQSDDIEAFKTLEEMIDDNTASAIEDAAKVCETMNWNRKTVVDAIRKMGRGLK